LLIRVKDLPKTRQKTPHSKGLHSPSHFLSKRFSDFFNAYTKAINKVQQRTGGLFETPFKRILVGDEAYFSRLIGYIHYNPQKHGLVNDYHDYAHSSYHSHLSHKKTKLSRGEVLGWFGDRAAYARFHTSLYSERGLSDLIIELD